MTLGGMMAKTESMRIAHRNCRQCWLAADICTEMTTGIQWCDRIQAGQCREGGYLGGSICHRSGHVQLIAATCTARMSLVELIVSGISGIGWIIHHLNISLSQTGFFCWLTTEKKEEEYWQIMIKLKMIDQTIFVSTYRSFASAARSRWRRFLNQLLTERKEFKYYKLEKVEVKKNDEVEPKKNQGPQSKIEHGTNLVWWLTLWPPPGHVSPSAMGMDSVCTTRAIHFWTFL